MSVVLLRLSLLLFSTGLPSTRSQCLGWPLNFGVFTKHLPSRRGATESLVEFFVIAMAFGLFDSQRVFNDTRVVTKYIIDLAKGNDLRVDGEGADGSSTQRGLLPTMHLSPSSPSLYLCLIPQ